ncbi:MAG: alpha-hydroxy acid oxidase [Burkholderiaceae bacterium]
MSHLQNFLSLADFERAASRLLPRCVLGYVRGGTEDERSLSENAAGFARLGFRPRGLRHVATRQSTVKLWGCEYAMPIGIAPTGLAGLIQHDCDLHLAREAAHAQLPFIISGSSSVPMEELQSQVPGSWYQAYFPGDPDRIAKIVKRLEAARIDVLVVTMDTCVAANRENNVRMDFTIPFRLTPRLLLDGMLHPRWSLGVFARTLLSRGVPRFANLYEEIGPPITEEPAHGFRTGRDALTWEHLKWLREQWRGKLVVKGLMHPDDATLALQAGVDAIIVSNHGGRQLDGTVSTLQALAEVVAVVPQEFPVFVDGGFRRGTDVLKAVALGAKMVFIGRPILYGAAVAGAAGIRRVLEIMRNEIDRDLALLGCKAIKEVTPDLLTPCAAPMVGTTYKQGLPLDPPRSVLMQPLE